MLVIGVCQCFSADVCERVCMCVCMCVCVCMSDYGQDFGGVGVGWGGFD